MRPIAIGYTADRQPLFLHPDDLKTSLHSIGASRSGKSKLAEVIARQLIMQRCGTCVIDPHGFLFDDLTRWLTYLRPSREIVLFNPSYEEHVVGFNPFRRGVGDIATHVDRHVGATLKCWGEGNGDHTPRLERRLKAVFHTVIEGGYSIEVIPYLLSFETREVRRRLTASISDPIIRREWAELDSYVKARDFYEQVESVRNRLFRFLGNRQVRRTMGLHHNSIDLANIIDSGKILLVNLQPSPVLSEENARLMGTLLLSELWHIGSQRPRTRLGKSPSDFFILIDEFWKFLTPDIPHMLSEGHKYGLHLMLFHQFLGQIAEVDRATYGAIETNARIKIAFGGISRRDANAMVDEMFPNQIDYKRVKHVLTRRAFAPVEDTFTTRSFSRGGSSNSGSQRGTNSGMSYDHPFDEKKRLSSGDSFSSSESSSGNWSETESIGPSIRYEEYAEIAGIQYYQVDEEIRQHADNLMDQPQRQFTIRIPGKPTVTAFTPYVREYGTSNRLIGRYTDRRVNSFLTAREVDFHLNQIHQDLAPAASADLPINFNPDDVWENKASRNSGARDTK